MLICNKVIGLGQCGTSLAKEYLRAFKGSSGAVSNMATDNAPKLFEKKDVLYLGVAGTGGDPNIGEEKARKDIDKLKHFLFHPIKNEDGTYTDPHIKEEDEEVIMFTSGGGGSGNGTSRVVMELLAEKGKKVLLVIVTPKRSRGGEGIKAKNNTIKLINWYITNFLKQNVEYVNIALADNQLLFDLHGVGKSKYDRVNNGIIEPFKTFWEFTNKRSYDFISGSNTNIDLNDIKRVLFDKTGGFVDFRTFSLGFEDKLGDTESMYYGSYDINTTSNYMLAIVMPKGVDKVEYNKKAEEIAKSIGDKVKTPNAFMSYFYGPVEKITGYMIVSGMRKSKSLEKLVHDVKKDYDKLQQKRKEEFDILDLEELDI
jgi:cell division GTPase FtsZ